MGQRRRLNEAGFTIIESTIALALVFVVLVGLLGALTAEVSWSPAQYATAARSVTISSYLFNAVAPPDPRLTGTGEANAGSFKVTGSLTGLSLTDANVSFPYVNGNIDSGFVRNAKGVARTTSSQIDLTGVLLSGMGCSVAGR